MYIKRNFYQKLMDWKKESRHGTLDVYKRQAAVKEKIKQSETWFCSQSDQLSVFPSGSYPIRVLIPVGPGEGRPMEGAVLLLDNGKPYTDKQISFASYTAILISRLLKNIEE